MSVEAVALPTALLLPRRPGGFDGYVVRDLTGEMKQFAEHWKKLHLEFDCIYTARLFSLSVEPELKLLKQFIRDFAGPDTRILVDPVFGLNREPLRLLTPDFIPAIVSWREDGRHDTPNRTEAALLTGLPLSTSKTLLRALPASESHASERGYGGSIGYLARLKAGDLLRVEKEKFDALHGAGRCVAASSLCGELLADGYAITLLRAVLRRLHPRNTAAPAGPLVRSGI